MDPKDSFNRPDRQSACLVDIGIVRSEFKERRAVALDLESAGVPFSVIVRALSDPDRRRAYPSSQAKPASAEPQQNHTPTLEAPTPQHPTF